MDGKHQDLDVAEDDHKQDVEPGDRSILGVADEEDFIPRISNQLQCEYEEVVQVMNEDYD
jgi:hypothetical protein